MSWSAANTLYYYQDRLGSTTHVANALGQLVESYRYDLTGTPSYYNSPNTQLSTTNYSVVDLYAGERWIPELGLYDLRNRMMSPALGRFLQADPIGLQIEGEKLSAAQKAFSFGGYAPEAFSSTEMNLYRYCHNDPINKSDPTGLYGMGTGWTDETWKKFDHAQQTAAARLEKASAKMDPKVFEKVFGKGSATAEKMAKVQHTMQGMAAALRDDGTHGHIANAFSDPKSSTLGVGNVNGNKIRINVGHRLFGSPVTLTQTVGHESGHNAGLNHVIGTNAPYKFGTEHQREIYKNLPTADRLRNPDNYMEFAE